LSGAAGFALPLFSKLGKAKPGTSSAGSTGGSEDSTAAIAIGAP
jgi:hypothetical protein